MVCSAHVGCTFKLLIKRTAGAFVCFSKGAHAAVSNEWKRSNSKLTKEQESFARKSLSTGAKPAEILAALTGDLLDEGKAKGTPPPKRAEGGLEGVYAAVNADGALNTYGIPVFLCALCMYSHLSRHPSLRVHLSCAVFSMCSSCIVSLRQRIQRARLYF